MTLFKTAVLATGLLASASYASALDLGVISRDGGYEYRHPSAWEKEQQRLRDDLAAAQKQLVDRDREIASLRSGSGDALRSAQADLDRSKTRVAELERQLADRDRELTSLRASAGDSAKLASQLSSTQGELRVANGRVSDLEKSLAAAGAGAAASQLTSSDKDKLTAELAAAN